MPPPNVKNDPQRLKHTAQGQSPGKCLHSLRAVTFHGQASASQENTPQSSAAICNLWFSSIRTSPLLHLLVHSQGVQQPSPSSGRASLQNTFHLTFSLLSSCPHFILFPDFSTARQISPYHHDYTYKKGCLKECKSPMIFKGHPFRIWGGLVWKERRSMAQASSLGSADELLRALGLHTKRRQYLTTTSHGSGSHPERATELTSRSVSHQKCPKPQQQ